MSQYVEFSLIDGSKVIIESDEREGGIVKAGLGEVTERARETFEQAAENAQKAAMAIVEKVRNSVDCPEEVEVVFGLKASGELGNLVVAKAGVEASYTVKLVWKKQGHSQQSVRSSRRRQRHISSAT